MVLCYTHIKKKLGTRLLYFSIYNVARKYFSHKTLKRYYIIDMKQWHCVEMAEINAMLSCSRAWLPSRLQIVLGFIDLCRKVRGPTSVWVVQQHDALVGFPHSLLGRWRTNTCWKQNEWTVYFTSRHKHSQMLGGIIWKTQHHISLDPEYLFSKTSKYNLYIC